ncbi:hypothetical protein AU106_gp083 [Sinorhizobium phage phiM9]|uniref:Tail fiber protein n=1 Tax=Sinorhizobium phage phiM9 TaxID=1636182 RepID=A0A0F6TGR1_9CAUD|nr:hypothetical protein AU106_gp083 [Sinorhizobium phage phiM9]AKE44714.1 hypothetical protein Sm_phiM9_084 [Sinorhizobium phage phiM9]
MVVKILSKTQLNTDLDDPVVRAKVESIAQEEVSAHSALTNNPHGVTKAQVGLSDVDNTADANKPVSADQQAAIDLAKDRANHTGTQEISTVNGLQEALDSKSDKAPALGAVGSYGIVIKKTAGTVAPGSTIEGTDLAWSNSANVVGTDVASGTWQVMGVLTELASAIAVRIS